MKTLVTGSGGMIGSEMVRHFGKLGDVYGIDNDMRADFFGDEGSTGWNTRKTLEEVPTFINWGIDIRARKNLMKFMKEEGPFDLVVHAAAQPSHDLSARRPLDDFDVNAVGTINMLEAVRQRSPDAVFVFFSTSKVYGDAPNELPREELATRYDYLYSGGVSEEMRIDASLHSPFGASKVAADLMTQEYGRYFGLRTVCLRGGCLTGPAHSAVELHGFLSYLVKCVLSGEMYNVYGYKGKQVRDNIHSADVAAIVEALYRKPPAPGTVYNIGGGRENSCSILEAKTHIELATNSSWRWKYLDEPRIGDHVVYISSMAKFKRDYPDWKLTKSLPNILDGIIADWERRGVSASK